MRVCISVQGTKGNDNAQNIPKNTSVGALVGAILCEKEFCIHIQPCERFCFQPLLPQVDKAFRREFSSRAELWGDAQAVYRDRGPHLDGPGWRAAGASLPPRTPLELLGKSPEVGRGAGREMGFVMNLIVPLWLAVGVAVSWTPLELLGKCPEVPWEVGCWGMICTLQARLQHSANTFSEKHHFCRLFQPQGVALAAALEAPGPQPPAASGALSRSVSLAASPSEYRYQHGNRLRTPPRTLGLLPSRACAVPAASRMQHLLTTATLLPVYFSTQVLHTFRSAATDNRAHAIPHEPVFLTWHTRPSSPQVGSRA